VIQSPADLPPLRDVIRRHGLSARRSFGQNFLLDMNITMRIVRAAGDLAGKTVFEVGPGPGGLTRALLASAAKEVVAVERDPRCVEALAELASVYPNRLSVIEGDAIETNAVELCDPPRAIIANLPYNIATPLLIGWLRDIQSYELLVLMFQREVADRLRAKPRTKAYGRLSVITQWLCDVRPAFNIPKDAFTPPPKVMSTVVSLRPHPAPRGNARWESLERITAAAFGQRRKMLRASLKPLGIDPTDADVDPTARAEELDVEQFCALARALEKVE